MDNEQLLAYATEFAFLPKGAQVKDSLAKDFELKVVRRAPGLFSVMNRSGMFWDGSKWQHGSFPEARTDEFKAKSRFPLDEAVKLALELVDVQRVNGASYMEWKERFANN